VTEVIVPAVLTVAMLLLVGAILAGLFTFTPERAQAIKLAEATETVVGVTSHLQVAHPISPLQTRLDRHDSYVWMNFALHLYGWVVVVFGPPYATLLSFTNSSTQDSLASSLVLGSGMCLAGSVMGSHLGRYCVVKAVCDNPYKPFLGDDIRWPYILGWAGCLITGFSMVVYGYTVVESSSSSIECTICTSRSDYVGWTRLLTSLGGITAIGVGCACVTLVPKFLLCARRYTARRDDLIASAVARIVQEDS
jgi:hypothetical protein